MDGTIRVPSGPVCYGSVLCLWLSLKQQHWWQHCSFPGSSSVILKITPDIAFDEDISGALLTTICPRLKPTFLLQSSLLIPNSASSSCPSWLLSPTAPDPIQRDTCWSELCMGVLLQPPEWLYEASPPSTQELLLSLSWTFVLPAAVCSICALFLRNGILQHLQPQQCPQGFSSALSRSQNNSVSLTDIGPKSICVGRILFSFSLKWLQKETRRHKEVIKQLWKWKRCPKIHSGEDSFVSSGLGRKEKPRLFASVGYQLQANDKGDELV